MDELSKSRTHPVMEAILFSLISVCMFPILVKCTLNNDGIP
ncbi:hypothetical protein C5167_003783 [Papaver somniferum]|uniref:Uncharacterized protein n=1 Tax=Papaver somniferum TaxID=3469 RepID=A0A4Y7L3N2_PAPSO|nr:hypothetical protein C5167_003783 [Papaver somniferum]